MPWHKQRAWIAFAMLVGMATFAWYFWHHVNESGNLGLIVTIGACLFVIAITGWCGIDIFRFFLILLSKRK